ncbi:MAG: carbon-nitrogen hydrolase family protein [Acidimicrobiales bacterium]
MTFGTMLVGRARRAERRPLVSPHRRVGVVLATVGAVAAVILPPAVNAAAGGLPVVPASPSCSRLASPTVVAGAGSDQVFAMQYFQDVASMASYRSIKGYVDCWFSKYLGTSYRHPNSPGLVVFNELTGLSFGLEGSRGAAARAFDTTPGATVFGQKLNEPLGALGGALGLLSANYARPIAWYSAKYPAALAQAAEGAVSVTAGGGTEIPASFLFLALTDTYVRAFVNTFSALARRYQVTVVAGGLLPILDSTASCADNGYAGWSACPGWRSTDAPAAVAALADPDLSVSYATGQVHGVYEAVTPSVSNAAFLFAPDGHLYGVQPKVNLTSLESELGWQPAPASTISTFPQYQSDPGGPVVPGVRLGVAISLDAFEHGDAAQPCTDPQSYVACLSSEGATVLLQPEFNDGTPQCASWSTFSVACSTPPQWQQLGWMLSSWYDVEAARADGQPLYPSFRYAVNAFMVGNLYDLTGDGQTAIFARNDLRSYDGSYIGDGDASLYRSAGTYSPYPDPVSTDNGSSVLAPLSLAELDGPQPGFLGLAPWVLAADEPLASVRLDPNLPAGDSGSLQSCTAGLVAGSGVGSGPCAENHYLPTAVIADLSF